MRRELRERFEKLKKGNPLPGKERRVARRVARRKERREGSGNPDGLQNCLDVRVTEEENVEIRFKEIPDCEAVKEEYRKVLQTALMGGDTIYKTLPGEVPKPRMPEY